jgi:hypothetical protein
MITPPLKRNSTEQLNMGEGKSSVIVPMIVCALADGEKLVRVIVLKALSSQMFHLLVARLGGLLNRRIFFLPFSRQVELTSKCLHDLKVLFEQCAHEGGVLLTQPEHILSLKLMTISTQIDANSLTMADDLERIQDWLSTHARDVLDESDELLHVQYQLVYTSGDQQALHDSPDRWTTIQQILNIVRQLPRVLRASYPNSVEYQDQGAGAFPHIRLLNTSDTSTVQVAHILRKVVASAVLGGELPNLNLGHITSPIDRHHVIQLLTVRKVTGETFARVKKLCEGTWNTVLLVRGLLAFDVLQHVLIDKRYRVNYGLDLKRSLLAVPYAAKACINSSIFTAC